MIYAVEVEGRETYDSVENWNLQVWARVPDYISITSSDPCWLPILYWKWALSIVRTQSLFSLHRKLSLLSFCAIQIDIHFYHKWETHKNPKKPFKEYHIA